MTPTASVPTAWRPWRCPPRRPPRSPGWTPSGSGTSRRGSRRRHLPRRVVVCLQHVQHARSVDERDLRAMAGELGTEPSGPPPTSRTLSGPGRQCSAAVIRRIAGPHRLRQVCISPGSRSGGGVSRSRGGRCRNRTLPNITKIILFGFIIKYSMFGTAPIHATRRFRQRGPITRGNPRK